MASIQFIPGIEEEVVPYVHITRSRDGNTGTATFRFIDAQILDFQLHNNLITGMFLIDKEGYLLARDISARFIKGEPRIVEVIYIMKNVSQWDRFMRFMKRYSQTKNLTFLKAQK